MLRHTDLCSGIGGFALGFQQAGLSHPVMFCDIEPWSRQILAKHWPDVPIAEDVKELSNDPGNLVPDCDILTAGYPCQPFSVAGKQRGTEDDRHIWPYIRKIVAFKRPTWCVFENVHGHVALGLDQVLADLEAEGYASRTFIVPACSVEASHRRDRLWIIARNVGNAEHNGSSAATVSGKHGEDETGCKEGQSQAEQFEGASEPGRDAYVGNTTQVGREGSQDQPDESQSGVWGEPSGSGENVASNLCGRQSQSSMGGMADGLSSRMDGFDGFEREPEDIPRVATGIKGRANRLRGLGNAIVPQIAERIGLTIKQMEH